MEIMSVAYGTGITGTVPPYCTNQCELTRLLCTLRTVLLQD
jgi:hypothetical protein